MYSHNRTAGAGKLHNKPDKGTEEHQSAEDMAFANTRRVKMEQRWRRECLKLYWSNREAVKD